MINKKKKICNLFNLLAWVKKNKKLYIIQYSHNPLNPRVMPQLKLKPGESLQATKSQVEYMHSPAHNF